MAMSLQFSRRLLRSAISYNTATEIGNIIARYAPHQIQRLAEAHVDFPVSVFVRNSRLLLIRIPKSASVSLSLQVYGRVSHIPHRSALFYKRSDPLFFNNVLSFAVMRDPAIRLESSYRWLKSKQFGVAVPHAQTRRMMNKISTFESFVYDYVYPAYLADRLHRLDPVVHRQSDYICDEHDNVIVKRLFRLDDMAEVQEFLRKNGVHSPEKQENASEGSGKKLFDDDIDEIVRRIYKRDFELYQSL